MYGSIFLLQRSLTVKVPMVGPIFVLPSNLLQWPVICFPGFSCCNLPSHNFQCRVSISIGHPPQVEWGLNALLVLLLVRPPPLPMLWLPSCYDNLSLRFLILPWRVYTTLCRAELYVSFMERLLAYCAICLVILVLSSIKLVTVALSLDVD